MVARIALVTLHRLMIPVSSQTIQSVQVSIKIWKIPYFLVLNFMKNFETSLVTFNMHYQSHAKSVNGMTWAAVVQAVEAAIRNKFVIYY